MNFGGMPLTADGVTSAAFVTRLNLATSTWTQASQSNSTFGTIPFRASVSRLALDAAGNVIVVGSFDVGTTLGAFTLTAPMESGVYVARLSASGQWTQAIPLGHNSRNAPPPSISAVAVDGAGTVTIAGILLETMAFRTTTLTSAGSYDVFVAKLNAAGQWTQAVRAGGTGSDIGNALALDAMGNVVVAGYCSSPATFGPTTLISPTSYPMAFVARLSGLALATHAATTAEVFTLVPNPTIVLAHLTWPEASAVPRPVFLLDALGRKVRSQLLPANVTSTALDMAGLTPGLYVVRCGTAATRLQVEKSVKS